MLHRFSHLFSTISKEFMTLILMMSICLGISAQETSVTEKRPVISEYSIEIGGARNISTYISPLYYEGQSFAFTGSWTKTFNHWSDRCRMRFEGALNFDHTINPAKTAYMYGLTAHFAWGLSWRKQFIPGLEFTLGPMVDLYGGALYLPRNGNNPVSVLASAGIDTSASLAYKFKLGRFPVIVSDELSVPTLSAFFCPGYGESYYEIYLGNHKKLAHFGWWGNNWSVNNLLSFKINFGKTGLLVGYRLDLRTFKANNLQTQVMRNAFVIGVIPNGGF